jgi:hypothetical protein
LEEVLEVRMLSTLAENDGKVSSDRWESNAAGRNISLLQDMFQEWILWVAGEKSKVCEAVFLHDRFQ